MTFSEAIGFIHSLEKFGVCPGLSRMEILLERLGNPQNGARFVHVAGTNGKGSVSTAIASCLREAGYHTGLYTSPYVTDFMERIQIDGVPADESLFASAVARVAPVIEEMAQEGLLVTEFEALTAAAFIVFSAAGCDITVLEVGLGGRLDATNVIPVPLVNVITSLSLDHTAILGSTLSEIAYEKCGTLKEGGTVVLSAGQPAEALTTVRKIARERKNRLIIPACAKCRVSESTLYGTRFSYGSEDYTTPMPGEHQLKNMTCVIEACRVLQEKGIALTAAQVKAGIAKTVLPARIEVLSRNPLVLLDGGHNADGAAAFLSVLLPERRSFSKLTVVAGMMADKAVEASIVPLARCADRFVAVTVNNPRSMKGEDLRSLVRPYCADTASSENACEALRKECANLKRGDALCVVGSLYLAGEVREPLLELCERFVKSADSPEKSDDKN